MVKVTFTSTFRAALGGADQLEVEATTIRELLHTLVAQYPDMQRHLDEGIAVAINGEIFRDNRAVPIPAKAEVYLIPRIQGG